MVLTILIGGAVAWWNPSGLRNEGGPGTEISEFVDREDLLWVDARSETSFREGSIPGAVLVNEGDWEAGVERFLEVWEPDLTVVVYCDSEACGASEAVAARLREELGIERVEVLKGGWREWLEQGR